MKHLVKISSVVILTLFSSIVIAQEEDTDFYDLSLEELMDISVVSASKTEEKSSNAPSTIYAVSKEQITARGYSNLEELLEDIPEIEIQRKSVTESSNLISFRGISGNERFLVLQNGIRIASVTGSPHAITHNYPVIHAERVEVILGPASALYGADAFTGIVNIITADGNSINGARLSTAYGNFNTTDNSFVVGSGNDDVSVMVTGKFYYSDEPNMPDYYKEEYSWYTDEYSQNGNLQATPDNPVTVPTDDIKDYETPTLAWFINTQIKLKDVQIGFMRNYETHNSSMGGRPEFNIYSKDARYDVMNQVTYMQHDFDSKDKKWSIQSVASHSIYEIAPESQFINTFTNYSSGYKYANSQKFKLDEKVSYAISDKYKLMAGITFEDINALPKTGDLPFKYNKDVPADLQHFYYIGTDATDALGNDLTIMQDFYNIHYQNYGSYLQFQGIINDKLRFIAGGRMDYNTRFGLTVNPRAGIVTKPIDKLSIKLLYGRAYLAPSPYNAYQHYGAFYYDGTQLVAPFWHLPNPDLDPEIVSTFEISSSYYLNNNIGIFADVYYNKATDLVVLEGSTEETFQGIPVGFAQIARNYGNAKTYGGTFRINGQYKTGNLAFNAYAAYSLSDGKTGDNPIPYSAMHTAKFGIDVQYGKFSISPRGLYRSPSKHSVMFDANGDPFENDAFVLINMFAKYKAVEKDNFGLDVFVKVGNLLNQKYYNVPLGGGEMFVKTPQDPIRIMGGIVVKM